MPGVYRDEVSSRDLRAHALPGTSIARASIVHVTTTGSGDGWHVDLPAALLVVTSALAYVRGTRTLWARAGHGRGIGVSQATSFGAGLVTLLIAVQPPIDAIAADLFAAHMVQHLLLVLV